MTREEMTREEMTREGMTREGMTRGTASDGRVSGLVEMSARQFHVISSHSAVSPLLSKFIK